MGPMGVVLEPLDVVTVACWCDSPGNVGAGHNSDAGRRFCVSGVALLRRPKVTWSLCVTMRDGMGPCYFKSIRSAACSD
jgi:hypothetical protein